MRRQHNRRKTSQRVNDRNLQLRCDEPALRILALLHGTKGGYGNERSGQGGSLPMHATQVWKQAARNFLVCGWFVGSTMALLAQPAPPSEKAAPAPIAVRSP